MLFVVIERFRRGKAPEVYRRLEERGRMMPAGLRYVSSWVDLGFERCFQVMEADAEALFGEWMARWNDLMEFEVVPVRTSAEAAAVMKGDAAPPAAARSPATAYERFERQHLVPVATLCAAEGWEAYADPDRARRALAAPGSVVLVAVAEGAVVGFVQLQTDGAIHAHVSALLVAPPHRRRGIGRRLMQLAASESGARYVDLVSTEGSHEFYRSFAHKEFPGFRIYPAS